MGFCHIWPETHCKALFCLWFQGRACQDTCGGRLTGNTSNSVTKVIGHVFIIHQEECHELVCAVEGEGVAREVPGRLHQTELVVNVPHFHCGADAIVCFWVILIIAGDEAQEIFEATFFK